jgi:hypothetical protein
MKPKTIYLILSIVGALAPYSQFVPWLAENGLNARLFLQHLFANRISTFFVFDVIISAVVLLRFAVVESARLRIRNRWLIVFATLFVGVSLGFPLFLYLRERQLEQHTASVLP